MVLGLSNILKIMSFSVTCILSLLVAGFSCAQLIRLDEDKETYIALLSSVMALWVPSPSSMLKINTVTEVKPSNAVEV